MRKSFTLIELMVVMSILTLLIEYPFTYLRNTFLEMNHIKRVSNLSFEAFRAMEVITKGIDKDANHLRGFISANEPINSANDKIEFNSVAIELIDKNLTIGTYNSNSLKFENLKATKLKNNLYEVSFSLIDEDVNYTKYSRIVYVH